MGYAVKEIFYTLQGEGALTGRPAVFCRFAGCNLWSGREADRGNAACTFCDTDFVGTDGTLGGRYPDAAALARQIAGLWPANAAHCFVVCTGGEPLLQLDPPLIAALHECGFAIAVETNGTLEPPAGIDWLCVSPKAGAALAVTAGDELKIVVPQPGLDPRAFEALDFRRFSVQPMDGPERARNTRLAIALCLAHPRWQLSLQTHKMTGIR
ncbi:MAG TPA: 7-carboxy-7-deazaguanine synthase [Stellaceae bacterium]|nr:7-carboxy-7-deazaguanine synthase [Stellaceae bacterium]